MWIYIVPVDWGSVLEMFPTLGTPSLDEIVRELQATGFPPISVDTGECSFHLAILDIVCNAQRAKAGNIPEDYKMRAP